VPYSLCFCRFGPESPKPVFGISTEDPASLLRGIVDRKLSIPHVIADRVFSSSEEAAEVIKLLSKAAVDLNLSHIVSELGQAEAAGTDILDNVPDVRPVLRVKVCNACNTFISFLMSFKQKLDKTAGQDAELPDGSEELAMEIPFNLDILRRHLAEVTLARRVLPEDVAARQKLLEESVYEVAVERLKHQADIFAELGLGNNILLAPDLRQWMWDWHTKLKARLVEEVKRIATAEKKRHGKSNATLLSPYLALVKPERLSLITILEIMRLQGSGGVFDGMKTTRALVAVGKAVELEYKAQMCRANKIHIPTTAVVRSGDGAGSFFSHLGYKHLQERRVAAARHMTDCEAWTAAWTQAVRSKVGGILVDCLMDVAEVMRTGEDKKTGQPMSVPFFFLRERNFDVHAQQLRGSTCFLSLV
jgi:DNA-directed RNA polymerase